MAAGVYFGVAVDNRPALDPVEHRVVVSGDSTGRADRLRTRGWSPISRPVAGLAESATVLFAVASVDTTAEVERDQRRLPRHGLPTSLLRSAT